MEKDQEQEYWCVVANIKQQVSYEPSGAEIKFGLKKFRAGAKVYIVGAYFGMAEDIIVIGQHRNSRKFIHCVIRASAVENLRVKKIYQPQIVEFLHDFQPVGATITTAQTQAEELMEVLPLWKEL